MPTHRCSDLASRKRSSPYKLCACMYRVNKLDAGLPCTIKPKSQTPYVRHSSAQTIPAVEEIWAWELKGIRNFCSSNVITSFYYIRESQLWSIADRAWELPNGQLAPCNISYISYHFRALASVIPMLVLSHHNIYLQLNVEDEPNLGCHYRYSASAPISTMLSRLRASICPC